jgi:hypothetical protein
MKSRQRFALKSRLSNFKLNISSCRPKWLEIVNFAPYSPKSPQGHCTQILLSIFALDPSLNSVTVLSVHSNSHPLQENLASLSQLLPPK